MNENPNTPSCLPTNSPTAMPSGTEAKSVEAETPEKDTPAFANPKIGTIKSATQANVACTPDRRTKYKDSTDQHVRPNEPDAKAVQSEEDDQGSASKTEH